MSIDRQALIALLDLQRVGVANSMRKAQQIQAFREELADAILKLDRPPAPDVADTGTLFPEL